MYTPDDSARLGVRDYERALSVFERCAGADSVGRFRESFLDALGSAYGCAHAAFFCTDSFTRTVADREPLLLGATGSLFAEYREFWWRDDIMFTPDSLARIRRSGVSALTHLSPRRVPPPARVYLDGFLFRRGFGSVCALDIDLPGGRRGVVGLFDREPDRLTRADLLGLEIVVRQVSAIARLFPAAPPPESPSAVDGLPPRLRQIAEHVGDGRTNAAIAAATGLSVDTVKKYVSQIFDRTGCHHRTELALLASRGRPRGRGAGTVHHDRQENP